MPSKVIFRREARTEYQRAAKRYELAREGLGERFRAEVTATIHQIVATPELFAVQSGDCRRALVRDFPYAVFFRIVRGGIRVVAVFHTHRDPAVWRQRVDDETK